MKARNIALIALLLAAAGIGFLWFRSPGQPALEPMPQPNGYDSFVSAGRMLPADPGNPDDLSTEALKRFVADSASALQIARAGLGQECRVPVSYSANPPPNRVAAFGDFKRLARAFVAEGELAERENRHGDAARSYLDAIRFGHESSRGGVLMDMLVGVAAQAVGYTALEGIVGHLDAATCREAIRQLEEIESKAESAEDIVNQERRWRQLTFGLRGRVTALLTWRQLRKTEQSSLSKHQAQRSVAKRLMTKLAGRAYELDRGLPPKAATDPVPDHLRTSL